MLLCGVSSVKLLCTSDDFILYFFVEVESSPIRCLVSEVRDATCGVDFSVWLSSIEGASMLDVYACFDILYFCCSKFMDCSDYY